MASEPTSDRPMSMVLRNIWCCTMIPMDRQTKSLWLPPEGVCITGPRRGQVLRRVPSWQCTFREWKRLAHDTLVLVPPHEPRNADERHGHAAEEHLGRAQVSGAFAYHSIVRPIDTQLPENELVLAVTAGSQTRNYPLREVRRGGGVLNGSLDGVAIVVWTSPEEDSFLMAAYERPLRDGKSLVFRRGAGDWMEDEETRSRWSLTGDAFAGPYAGTRLVPLNSTFSRWHAWGWSHWANDVARAEAPFTPPSEPPPFDRLFSSLRGSGFEPSEIERVLSLQLPNEAVAGFSATVRSDRLLFLQFPDVTAAADYCRASERTARIGDFVVQSSPAERLRFRDSLQTQRIPSSELRWSPLVNRDDPGGADFLEAVDAALGWGRAAKSGGTGLGDVVDRLASAGWTIDLGAELVIDGYKSGLRVTELTRRQLRPGALSAYQLRIDRDDFLLYKFQAAEHADRYGREEPHAIRAGNFVLRSTPRRMYQFPVWGFARLPDDQVPWSKLLDDPAFAGTFEGAVRGMRSETAVQRHAHVASTRHFDRKSHLWVEAVADRVVRVGLSSFGAREYGPFYAWALPAAGTAIRRGEPMATGLALTGEEALPGPVDGVVRRTNEGLAETPELVQQDPYGSGWLLELEHADVSSAALVTQTEYEAALPK